MLFKVCTHCRVEKNESCFYAQKNTRDGLASWCKDCVKQQHKHKRGTAPPVPKISMVPVPAALRAIVAAVESGYHTAPRIGRLLGIRRQVASKWLNVAAARGDITKHRCGVYGQRGSAPPEHRPHDAAWREHAALERRLATASRALHGLALRGTCLFCERREHAPDCPRLAIESWIQTHRGQFSPCVAKVVQYA